MPFKNFREESKKQYGADQNEVLNIEELNAGSLLRIADATELMASNYLQMQRDMERLKIMLDREKEKNERLKATVAALCGHVTRLKKLKTQ